MSSYTLNYVSVRYSFQLDTVLRLGKISHTRKKNHCVILPFIQGVEVAVAGDVDKNVALS